MLSTSFHAKNAEIVFWSKFLATRTKGHFWTRFNRFPCPPFKWFFNLFHGPLKYAIYKFCAKTPPLYSNQNYWQVGHRIFFFFLQHIFLFVFWATIYAIYKFSCKNADIEFRKKFFASRTSWHFRTKFNKICFSYERFFQLFLGPLNMLSKSFSAKMPKLCSGQNSWPVGPRGIMEQIWTNLFTCKRFFHLFLEPLYMLYSRGRPLTPPHLLFCPYSSPKFTLSPTTAFTKQTLFCHPTKTPTFQTKKSHTSFSKNKK